MSEAATKPDGKGPPPRKEFTLRKTASIVPEQSVQGRALLAVIVIMGQPDFPRDYHPDQAR